MKIKYLLLPISIMAIFCCETFAFSAGSYPTESLPTEAGVLLLPKNMQQDWKNIFHRVNEQEGMAEYIPSNQSKNNISDLISVFYFNTSDWDQNLNPDIESIFESIQKQTFNSKNRDKHDLKILEKNESDIIYEYICVRADPNFPMEHDLARIFLTDKGFHRISYTHMGKLMKPDEKKNWLNILKKHTSIQSIDRACLNPQAFSLLCRLSISAGKEKS